MKNIITVLCLFVTLGVFADTVILNDNQKIDGKISEINEEQLTIIAEYGKVIIKRSKIRSINFYDNFFEPPVSKKNYDEDVVENEENITKNNKNSKYNDDPKADPLYDRYEKNIAVGVGFIITGSLFLIAGGFVGIPLTILIGYSSYGYTSYDQYGNVNTNPTKSASLTSSILFTSTGLILGIIFELIAISGFSTAEKYKAKWNKKYLSMLDVQISDTQLGLTFSYKF